MKNYKWVLPILLFGIIGIYVWNIEINIKKLRKDHMVVCATISSTETALKGYDINYYFIYKGKKIEIKAPCTEKTNDRYNIDNLNKILVVVSKSNPYNNATLENEGDYENFNIVPEDTAGVLCNP